MAATQLGRCPCGGIILADTENCTTPVCYQCATEISESLRPSPQDGFQRLDRLTKDDHESTRAVLTPGSKVRRLAEESCPECNRQLKHKVDKWGNYILCEDVDLRGCGVCGYGTD